MIAITTDDHELKALIQETTNSDKATVFAAVQLVRAASLSVERKVKAEMPVDTGRARASWGHGKDSIWTIEENGLAIVQGSNVEYIIYLERGHSRQAPAGFIERAALIGEFELLKAVGLLDPLEPLQLPLFGMGA